MKCINSDMLRHLFEVWKEIEEKAGNDKGAYCYNECVNAIDKMPSDNIVEIVRCEDCKHYEWAKGVCHNPRYGDGHANYPPPCVREDFFCADGETKDN